MPPFGSTRNLTQQFIRLRNEARRLQGLGASTAHSDRREDCALHDAGHLLADDTIMCRPLLPPLAL